MGYGDFSYMGVPVICTDVAVSRLWNFGVILCMAGRILAGISLF